MINSPTLAKWYPNWFSPIWIVHVPYENHPKPHVNWGLNKNISPHHHPLTAKRGGRFRTVPSSNIAAKRIKDDVPPAWDVPRWTSPRWKSCSIVTEKWSVFIWCTPEGCLVGGKHQFFFGCYFISKYYWSRWFEETAFFSPLQKWGKLTNWAIASPCLFWET